MSSAKLLLILYIAALHAALAALVFAPATVGGILMRVGLMPRGSFYQDMLAYQLLSDRFVPTDAVIFVGDSQIQGLDVDSVASRAANYGIGGDTTAGVLRRLPLYASLDRARTVVLEVGTNDLAASLPREIIANYAAIVAAVPRRVGIVVNAVLPVSASKSVEGGKPLSRNQAIEAINRGLAEICAARPGCAFLDPGRILANRAGDLAAEYDRGDGLHLNPAGYRVWSEILRAALGAPAG